MVGDAAAGLKACPDTNQSEGGDVRLVEWEAEVNVLDRNVRPAANHRRQESPELSVGYWDGLGDAFGPNAGVGEQFVVENGSSWMVGCCGGRKGLPRYESSHTAKGDQELVKWEAGEERRTRASAPHRHRTRAARARTLAPT